jgi:hypothetical protein
VSKRYGGPKEGPRHGAKGAEHAKKDHGIAAIPPDMVAKVQAAIKDK